MEVFLRFFKAKYYKRHVHTWTLALCSRIPSCIKLKAPVAGELNAQVDIAPGATSVSGCHVASRLVAPCSV